LEVANPPERHIMSDDQIAAKDKALEDKQKEVDAVNEKRMVGGKDKEGKDVKVYPKGTLLRMGQTRGKNPQIVTWEAFDESHPETLPSDLSQFMDLAEKFGGKLEPNILAWVIDGFNSAQYTAASDPIAEFVEASWPEDIQKNFRMAVRNYATATNSSIEDAVTLIKPGIVKALEAKKS